MKTILSFITILLLVSCSAQFPQISPKKTRNANQLPLLVNQRIVGGNSATADQYPFIATLLWTGWHFCGGSILRKTYPAVILTAAHCDIYVSDTVRLNADDTVGSNMDSIDALVTHVLVHPDYNSWTAANDIALVWIDTDISANPNVDTVKIKPVSPQSDECCSTGDKVQAIGYGADSFNGPNTLGLEYVDLKYVSQAVCDAAYPLTTITDTQNCAASPSGDACQRDGGGPLIKKGTNKQIGIVSWGMKCDKAQYPGVYTEVGAYSEWINCKIGQYPPPIPPKPICNDYDSNKDKKMGLIECGDTVTGFYGAHDWGLLWKFKVKGPLCEISAKTCDSKFDTGLSVHKKDGSVLQCDDDGCGDFAAGSKLTQALPSSGFKEYFLKLEGYGTSAGPYELKFKCTNCVEASTGGACIKSCQGKADGDYQSCNGCSMYATCSNGIFYDNRPCAASSLKWDDNKKYCDWTSATCTGP